MGESRTRHGYFGAGVDMIGSNIWDQVLLRIETKVNRHTFYTWFKPTSLLTDDGPTIRVRVPNALFKDWLTKHYSAVLEEALDEVRRPGTAVSFVTDELTGGEAAPPPAATDDVPVLRPPELDDL